MGERAAVVIIGGGVTGASIASHLADRGETDVVLVEKNRLATAATSNTFGDIKSQYAHPTDAALSHYSVERFETFEEETGRDPEFYQDGYLSLATTERTVSHLRDAISSARDAGVPVEELSPAELSERYEELRTDDVELAALTPKDGYLNGYEVAMGYAEKAERLGVSIRENVEVTDVRTEDGVVAAVETSEGTIEADAVVNATNAWAPIIGDMVGVEIPISPYPLYGFASAPVPWYYDQSAAPPVVKDMETGLYFRPEPSNESTWMGVFEDDPEPIDLRNRVDDGDAVTKPSTDVLLATIDAVAERIPRMESAEIMREWGGVVAFTPDGRSILDETDVEGFYVAAGHGAHGVLHAPAIGAVMASKILGDSPPVDVSTMTLDRFFEPADAEQHDYSKASYSS